MEQLEGFAQTYTQAPWRKQLQIIGLFSLALVFIALIAGIYLNVSAQAATVGREIQKDQKEIDEINQEIEDLQSRLAILLSDSEMEKRARDLGFEPIDTDQVTYLMVRGYVERQPIVLAPYSGRTVVSAPVVPPEYTESFFTWIKRSVVDASPALAEVQP
jgi:cell division protein FtsL